MEFSEIEHGMRVRVVDAPSQWKRERFVGKLGTVINFYAGKVYVQVDGDIYGPTTLYAKHLEEVS
jgi:hypothetical protein